MAENYRKLYSKRELLDLLAEDLYDTQEKNANAVAALNDFYSNNIIVIHDLIDNPTLMLSSTGDTRKDVVVHSFTRLNDDGSVETVAPLSSEISYIAYTGNVYQLDGSEDKLTLLKYMAQDPVFASLYPAPDNMDSYVKYQDLNAWYRLTYGQYLSDLWKSTFGLVAVEGSDYAALYTTRRGWIFAHVALRSGVSHESLIVYYVRTSDYVQCLATSLSHDSADIDEMLHSICDSNNCQSILSSAISAIRSGSTSMADLASMYGLSYSTMSAKSKALVSNLVGSTNSDDTGDSLISATLQAYTAMSKYEPEDDGCLEWGELDVPAYDGAIGTIVADAIVSGVQLAAAVGLAVGGVVVKIVSAAVLLGSYIFQRIQNTIAQKANTAPRFETDTDDDLFGYPLLQLTGEPISALRVDAQERLKEYGAIRLITPFYVIFCYNYNSGLNTFDSKVFLKVQSDFTGDSQYNLGALSWFNPYNNDKSLGGEWRASSTDSYTNWRVHFSGFSHMRDNLGIAANREQYRPRYNVTVDHYDTQNNDGEKYPKLYREVLTSLTYLMFSAYICTKARQKVDSDEVVVPFYALNHENWNEVYTGCSSDKSFFIAMAAKLFGGSAKVDDQADVSLYEYWDTHYNISLEKYTTDTTFHDYGKLLNNVLPGATGLLSTNDFLPGLYDNPAADVVCFAAVPRTYAITPATLSYKAVIFAEVIAVVAIAALMIGGKVLKTKLSRKLETKVLTRINRYEKWRDDIKSMTRNEGESLSEFKIRRTNAMRALYRSVRKFNLWTKMLGMGGFDVGAGFWDGPTTLGGNWGSISSMSESLDTEEMNSETTQTESDLIMGEQGATISDIKNLIAGE